MKKHLLFLCCILLATACSHPDNSVLVIDVSQPRPAQLEALTDHFNITPLDEREELIPAINLIKKYGDLLFLGNQRLGEIVVYDGERPIGKLSAKGKAQSEYGLLFNFEYREETSELVIYDLNGKINSYHVPDMTYVGSEPIKGVYLNTLEVINPRYSYYGGNSGPVLWDHQTRQPMDTIALPLAQRGSIDAFYPVQEPGCASVLFCIPGPVSRIMRASADGFEEVRKFQYNPDVTKKFWELTDDEELAQEAYAAVSSRKMAMGAKAPLFRGDDFAWWYYTGMDNLDDIQPEPAWRLVRCVDGKQEVFSELRLEGYPEPIQPQVTDGRQWGMVLELAMLEKISAPNEKVYPLLRELSDQGYEHALLMFDVL